MLAEGESGNDIDIEKSKKLRSDNKEENEERLFRTNIFVKKEVV